MLLKNKAKTNLALYYTSTDENVKIKFKKAGVYIIAGGVWTLVKPSSDCVFVMGFLFVYRDEDGSAY